MTGPTLLVAVSIQGGGAASPIMSPSPPPWGSRFRRLALWIDSLARQLLGMCGARRSGGTREVRICTQKTQVSLTVRHAG